MYMHLTFHLSIPAVSPIYINVRSYYACFTTTQCDPLAQSVEPWNLDRRVPGSSQGQGGGLCSWAIHLIHIAQLESEMIRLCDAEVKSKLSRIYK